jgi:endonuclease/exonuclease/phosphatase family metal-dependent hydrolase
MLTEAQTTEETSQSQPRNLTILLWNVWLLPPFLSNGITRSRASKISPLLANYDVVILNEAFMYKAQLLSQTKYPYRIILRRRSWFDFLDSGIIILSAHPIINFDMEHFHTRGRWDRLACKGIIFCRLRLPTGDEIDIYGTHMQAGYSESEQSSRDQQACQLSEFILRHSGEEERHVVLGGDMNMGPARCPDLQGYSVHYSSPLDAKRRVGTYESLKKTAKVRDVISPGWEQDINRFLVRGIEHAEVEYLEKPKYDDTRYLSDSERLVCRIALL